ncbi:hypothetical protein [Bacillus sp. FSL K6-6540]|uniref:hypothetical protein n=1 Tax=Bacillus sp. FSL K6-6540 TaxID=2921512 RepID=UPI0030FD14C3
MQVSIQHQPILVLNRVEQFFQLLYGAKMAMYPKKYRSKKTGTYHSDRQWIFVGTKEKMTGVATLSTLFAKIHNEDTNQNTYYTPNGYYRKDQRLTESLRWLNGFVFDVDREGLTLVDILDVIDDAGLPHPTAILKTPSGGYHITYVFDQPVRATRSAVYLYTAIMRHMAEDLKSDLAAVGANRIFRLPTEENLVYFEASQTYSFEVFKNWREINHPYQENGTLSYHIQNQDIMAAPALQRLLYAPCEEGKRDRTCFTLALAMKASNWPICRAVEAITEWYMSQCAKGARAGKQPFLMQHAIRKVHYVYSKSKLLGPSAEAIRELSGMAFHFAVFRSYEGPKLREDRERSHYQEWINDLLALLCEKTEISGSQNELACLIQCPLSTFKIIVHMLVDQKKIEVETKRGRGGYTTIRIIPDLPVQSDRTSRVKVQSNLAPVYYVDFETKNLVGVVRYDKYDRNEDKPPDPG